MGARKHIAAEKLKEARKNLYFAKLKGVPSSESYSSAVSS